MPNIDLSILNQRQTPAFYADVFANRPAAGFVGRIFVSTDTYAFYRDNGTSWDLIGGPGTGTITGSGSSGSLALWNGTNTITYDVAITWNGTDNSISADKFIVNSGTSSQFLKANGSLDSNTYNTGSGAANQVAFFSGTNSISGENNLWWDSTNNHFGINTNTPGTAADIHHNQSTILQLNQTTATNDTRIAFQNSGTSLWRIGNFYNGGANDLGIFDVVGNIQPVTVKKNTGQVLIGTSTVGAGKLVVASATGDNGIQIVGATAPSLRIDSAESGPTKRAGLGISTATNNFIQGSADRDFCIFNGSTAVESPILFGIYAIGAGNVQEAARISAARNFLIGTTTDSGEKLIVNGAAKITGVSYFNRGTLQFTLNPSYGGFNVYSQLQSTGDLALASGGDNNRLYITSAGNVGIGTTSPTEKLVVSASSSVTVKLIGSVGGGATNNTQLRFYGQNAGADLWAIGSEVATGSTGKAFDIYNTDTSTPSFRITGSTNNVLIGTTTDNGLKLQVNGNTSSYAYVGTNSVTVSALNTDYTILNSAYNGILTIRDNELGGTDLWLVDPNLGTIKISGNIVKTYSITYSGGVYLIRQTAGTVPVRYSTAVLSS